MSDNDTNHSEDEAGEDTAEVPSSMLYQMSRPVDLVKLVHANNRLQLQTQRQSGKLATMQHTLQCLKSDMMLIKNTLQNLTQQQQAQQQALMQQAGQLASAPMMDPSKNPAMAESFKQQFDQANGTNQGQPPAEGAEETPA